MTPHIIPNIHDDSIIFASTWTTYKKLHLLQFLFLKYDSSNLINGRCKIPYSELDSLDSNWKDGMQSLFSINFLAMENEHQKCKLHWIEYMLFDDKHKLFFYRLCQPVENALIFLKKEYTDDYEGLVLFTRTTSYKIYKYIKEHINQGTLISTSCQELMKICGIKDGKYKNISEFKRFILKYAVSDINQLLNWNLKVESKLSNIFFIIEGKSE